MDHANHQYHDLQISLDSLSSDLHREGVGVIIMMSPLYLSWELEQTVRIKIHVHYENYDNYWLDCYCLHSPSFKGKMQYTWIAYLVANTAHLHKVWKIKHNPLIDLIWLHTIILYIYPSRWQVLQTLLLPCTWPITSLSKGSLHLWYLSASL